MFLWIFRIGAGQGGESAKGLAKIMDPLVGLARDARVQVRRQGDPNPDGRCVVYWMQRSQRAVDNPALNVAIEAANALRKPVVVFIGLLPFYPNSNLRSCAFFADGLPDIRDGLEKRRVGLVVHRWPEHELSRFCEKVNPCIVIGDENPMREPEAWRRAAAEQLCVPFWTVDSDVIVPSALLKKEQFGARTIRPRIHALLGEFLLPPGNPSAEIPWKQVAGLDSLRVGDDLLAGFPIDLSVQPFAAIPSGTRAGLSTLRKFVKSRLASYAGQRNQPDLDGTSQLSPYLHFGQIGPHTVALAVKNADAPREDREAFLEQLIVRRELSINFVRFNPNYDRLKGAETWALRTHQEHRRDDREYLYSASQLENAETHDPLWNASQRQMVVRWLDARLSAHVLGQEDPGMDALARGGVCHCCPPE